MKIAQLENKNQFVITLTSHNTYIFVSYRTPIAYINYENKYLIINEDMWAYSKTTLKHFYLFIKYYGFKWMRDLLNKYEGNKRKSLQYYIDNGHKNLDVLPNEVFEKIYNSL